MKAVIIAAGAGSRLEEKTNGRSKTLLPLGAGTVLSAILSKLSLAGISDFYIVVGCQSESITGYVENHDHFGLPITFIQNNKWFSGIFFASD